MQTTLDTHIDRDREYDQTAVSMSQPDGFSQPSDFARPMPDVIRRHGEASRLNQPSLNELVSITAERDSLRALLQAAETRIWQFEQFSRSLAEHIDAVTADFIFLTGKTINEWLIEAKAELDNAAVVQICRSPIPLNAGFVCLLDKGHSGPCSSTPQPPPVNMDRETQGSNIR